MENGKTINKESFSYLSGIQYAKYVKKRNVERMPLFDLSKKEIKNRVWNFLGKILQLNEPQNKEWNFYNNIKQTALLTAWFCNDIKIFNEIANEIEDSVKQKRVEENKRGGTNKLTDEGLNKLIYNYNINKDLYVCGIRGSGKSSTIKALNELITQFAAETKRKKTRMFKFCEQNKISNTFRIEGNINKYTFNETIGKFEGLPQNIIIDDLKINDNTKSYGTNFIEILIQLLYDRYSIWLSGDARTIITSLLTPPELRKFFPEKSDLYDRFKHQYNVIVFNVNERNV